MGCADLQRIIFNRAVNFRPAPAGPRIDQPNMNGKSKLLRPLFFAAAVAVAARAQQPPAPTAAAPTPATTVPAPAAPSAAART